MFYTVYHRQERKMVFRGAWEQCNHYLNQKAFKMVLEGKAKTPKEAVGKTHKTYKIVMIDDINNGGNIA